MIPYKPGNIRRRKQNKDQESLFMMRILLGVKDDQYENKDSDEADESDKEEVLLRTVVQEIEKSHILLLTLIWEEVLCEISCDLGI